MMKRTHSVRAVLFPAVLACLVLAGCASSPSKFYTLTPTSYAVEKPRSEWPAAKYLYLVGPVSIPDYLDRPQIVTRDSGNRLVLNDFERWGGALQDDINGVLVENIAGLLNPYAVAVTRGTRGISGAYRSGVDITRFDLFPGEKVVLHAVWGISTIEGRSMMLARESTITVPLKSADFSEMVAAMSKAIGILSEEMVAGLKSVVAAAGAPDKPAGAPKEPSK